MRTKFHETDERAAETSEKFHWRVSCFWHAREVKISGSERVNTALSRSGRVDDIQSHPQAEIRRPTKLVKITGDVRKFAAKQKISGKQALQVGLKPKEFAQKGAKIYVKV